MILLPHGCSCSEPRVTPKNWKSNSKANLKKIWRIYYYFRDPQFKNEYPHGKLINIKGMNGYKSLKERQAATEHLIKEELYLLKVHGYNPISRLTNGPDIHIEHEINPETPICDAIEVARSKIQGAKSTLADLKVTCKAFNKSCRQIRYDAFRVGDIKRIHIKHILENQAKQNNYSNKRFNKIRSYIMMVFKELVQADAIDFNPIKDIPKKKETIKLRETLSDDQVKKIKKHLKDRNYNFYRYMNIFFHSGCRSTELFNLKVKDVDINNQRFKVTVKKGRNYEEQWRAINKNAVRYWIEIIKSAKPSDYVFSYRFSPGPTKISPRQVTGKWRKLVKKELGIEADFYSLKHLHTTKVIELYNSELAASINGHKSTAMNLRHYDVGHKTRVIEAAKNINVSI